MGRENLSQFSPWWLETGAYSEDKCAHGLQGRAACRELICLGSVFGLRPKAATNRKVSASQYNCMSWSLLLH
jgi:hypothetical protein